MCGIAGLLSDAPLPLAMIAGMNRLLRHRGPDDEGFLAVSTTALLPLGGADTDQSAYGFDGAYRPLGDISATADPAAHLLLGHRRLAIVDLSPYGHQPMSYGDRYWIVYNGEVYNHLELRAELESQGYCFHSHADTEVILAAYDCWGESCLERFNGMWAFALYDRQRRTLFLARDRFGVKPLYYWISPAGFLAFASEIKAFTVLPGWQPRVNGQRVYDFLAWNVMDHTDETMFAGVFQLQGGQSVLLDTDAAARRQFTGRPGARLAGVKRWYTLVAQPVASSPAAAAEGFRELFEDAVRLRLRADVPVGSCLSGGLDSSSIVCVANRQLRRQDAAGQQKTFSACVRIKRFDERQYMEAVVDATGVAAHYTYPELEGLLPLLDELTWHQDEPFGSTSIYAQWSVFKLAADNRVKVMLDGQGADEVLGGYHSYFGPLLGELARGGRWLDLLREFRAMHAVHGHSYSYLAQRLVSNLFPALRLKAAFLAGTSAHSTNWLDHERLGAELKDPNAETSRLRDVREMSLAQLTAISVPMLLHCEDRDSMAHSVESRVPFLDYRLVEFVLGLPDDCKLAGGVTKRVLREGLCGILPDEVRDRMDKLGFVTPEEVWLKETGTAQFEDLLKMAIDNGSGIIKPEILKIFRQMVGNERPFNFFLWRVISFGNWLKRFNVDTAGGRVP